LATKVEIKVMGQKFWVTHEKGEAHIKKLAGYVNDKVLQLRNSTGAVASYRLALLAALDIADERFSEAEQRKELEELVKKRVTKIIEKLKRSLTEEESG